MLLSHCISDLLDSHVFNDIQVLDERTRGIPDILWDFTGTSDALGKKVFEFRCHFVSGEERGMSDDKQ